MKVAIELENRAATTPFADLSLQLSYFLTDKDGTVVPKTTTYSPLTGPSVQHVFEETLALARDVYVALVLHSTSTLAQLTVPAKAISERTPIVLAFDYEMVTLETPETPAAPGRPLFVYGRLLEKNGSKKLDDVQIIIEAVRADDTSDPAVPQPIASVRTETNGYFFIEYPDGHFKSAQARVGMDVVENPVPIRLVAASEPETLEFPRSVILVVELPTSDAPESDCNCGCGALDVHEPKRVLQEFSFYSLVRTTEPEIQGFVLEEEHDISLSDILNNHPIRGGEILDPVLALPVFNQLRVLPRLSHAIAAPPVAAAGGDDVSTALESVKVDRGVLSDFLKREGAVTKDNVIRLIDINEALRFRRKVKVASPVSQPLGRVVLDATHTVDWDDEPTLYQSVSVAHGHLLHFKSEWVADGYSLGDLLYSLPLAPGQKKQVVVFDWERRESAANQQEVDYQESLDNSLSRDRDINEITRGAISEHTHGTSSATTMSASAGVGGYVGVLFGVSGGVGHSGSTADQNSLRQTSASDLQKITDRLVQSANAVRSQRSSVIQTVSQGERFEVSAETVANYNHCHAITIQYFEVLRHFKVRQRLADARECLFVPLLMSPFDLNKALRWKEALRAALIDDKHAKAFDAAERVKNEWSDSNFPSGTFASERILTASGNFQIRFIIRRPDDMVVEMDDYTKPIFAGNNMIVGYQKKKVEDINEANWQSLIPFLGSDTPRSFYDHYLRDAKDKDEVFHRLLGEKIALSFVDALTFHVADETGNEIATMAFDPTLTSRYRKEGVLNVSLRFMGPSTFAREKIYYLRIRCGTANQLPDYSNIFVEAGFIRYRTAHYEGFLCRYEAIRDDLSASDGATLFAGPSNDELRDPRKDDLASVNKLIDHLNDNLEVYHRAMWSGMSAQRRFLLLDGILLPGEKGMGRSLASLVENELIGVVGNSLVFPVAQGLNLDPNFGLSDSLTEFYMVNPSDPVSISVPTKGVYAEAMMGACNSCEEKDESRFWRWEESPIPDSPTAINPINTDTRRADPGNLQPTPLPTPVVNIQNAPAAPDPTGLAGTLSLLGKADAFKDITGLAGNQTSALEALKASYDATKTFGQEAAKLEIQKMMDRRLDTAMKAINNAPNLDTKQKADLYEKALNAYLGAGATSAEAGKDKNAEKMQDSISKNIDKVNASKSGEVTVSKPDGSSVATKFNNATTPAPAVETRIGKGGITPIKQDKANACWATVATMMMRWKDSVNYTVEQVLTKAGQEYLKMYTDDTGLPVTQKDAFVATLGMKGEPLGQYTAANYRDWLVAYGPLWVTTDSDPTKGFSAHARIITGISNDLKTLELIDPAQGVKVTSTFEAFAAELSAVVTDSSILPTTQVVHFTDKLTDTTEGSGGPTADPVKYMNEYNPEESNTIIINTASFDTGIAGITNYHNWKTDPSVIHNQHKNAYRSPHGIIHLVLHETAGETGNGFDDSKNETSHMSVRRDATVLQFNDLAELENHASGMNTTGIGVEFVNRSWLASKTTNGGEGIPSSEAAMTAQQKNLYKESNGYLWLFWGQGFNIYRVPPSLPQLEKEVEVVQWLTTGLTDVIQSSGSIAIENMFPSIDATWLQLVSYDDVSSTWQFETGEIPAEADRATKNLFVMTTGYGVLEPTNIRTTSGIVSHNATYAGHPDGSYLTLYTWLRLAKGKDANKAYELCSSLMKNHMVRAALKTNPYDQKVFLVNVSDGNLV